MVWERASPGHKEGGAGADRGTSDGAEGSSLFHKSGGGGAGGWAPGGATFSESPCHPFGMYSKLYQQF